MAGVTIFFLGGISDVTVTPCDTGPVYEQYDSGSAVLYWLDRWTRYQKVPGSILTMYMYTALCVTEFRQTVTVTKQYDLVAYQCRNSDTPKLGRYTQT